MAAKKPKEGKPKTSWQKAAKSRTGAKKKAAPAKRGEHDTDHEFR